MPADIVGGSVYERGVARFGCYSGRVFIQRLATPDEINRTRPKVQSAFLESMAEGQVGVDAAKPTPRRPSS